METTRRTRRCSICKEPGHNARTCTFTPDTQQVDAQQAVAEKTAETLQDTSSNDLGVLSIGGKQVFVSLMPSQANAMMVKYEPEIQVSCVIPPQEFEVEYGHRRDYRSRTKTEITTPTLIMSCGYGDVPTTRNYASLGRNYTLWAINTDKLNKIYAKAYVFANVYQNGSVCFGTLYPKSLRQAYNQYWTSSFNNDLFREKHTCDIKIHRYSYHNGHSCDPSYKEHTCECSKTTFHRHRGCGCTTVAGSKKCKGSCGNEFSASCDCCVAINAKKAALQAENPNISSRALNKASTVEGIPYPGCGCSFRHKRGCSCGKNRCDCNCLCPCCQKNCNHSNCECSCCKNTCSCSCNCTDSDKFKKHIVSYHADRLPAQKWVDRTSLFCGTKFWASPKGAMGVLICNERLLLNQVPRKFWKKDKNGHPVIIAAANFKDGIWTFECGPNLSFSMREANVLAK